MKRYSVGFLFADDNKSVALITKARPEWQKGLLNEIGGHIEDDETALRCMIREFEEETGVHFYGWTLAVVLKHERYELNIYRASIAVRVDIKNPDLQEPVDWYPVKNVTELGTIPNLAWLIPLLLDRSVKFPIHIEDTGR